MSGASAKPRVLLLHWKQEEIAELAARISPGFDVDACVPVNSEGMKVLAQRDVPSVLVVCLDRLPSHGHAVAHHYRNRKATRHVPVVFVGGVPEKVEKIRAVMPGTRFCSWKTVVKTVREACENPIVSLADAVKSKPQPERPLYLKLFLREGMHVALLAAPRDLSSLVPDLPFELDITEEPRRNTDLTMWFVRSAAELDDGFAWITAKMAKPRIWVFYSRQNPERVTWASVSEIAAPYGLGQFKVLRLDNQWTGVAFGRRSNAPKE